MLSVLIVFAWIATAALIVTGLIAFSRAHAFEPDRGRGQWGVLNLDWRRSRRLDAQQLRWQTALIAGRKRPTGWSDMVAAIETLERTAGAPSDPAPPDRHDRDWVDARLVALEDLAAQGDTDND